MVRTRGETGGQTGVTQFLYAIEPKEGLVNASSVPTLSAH